ncbi:MAG TPA: zf-HC2 domain-containing protein [Ktedonobacterales bacterium]|nr:zf-HC2 domain-containing protein [Ktedonobacterales bacterium]
MRRSRLEAGGASSEHGTRHAQSTIRNTRRRGASCEKIRPLIEAFHDGSLALDQADRVAAHLATCASCAARLAEIASLDRLIGTAPLPRTPTALRSRLYARIAAAETSHDAHSLAPAMHKTPMPSGTPVRRPLLSERGRRRRISLLASAVSAVGIAAMLAIILLTPRIQPQVAQRAATRASNVATAPVRPRPAMSHITASLAALPHFADWRAAYLSQDQKLHIVSADGNLDIAAPSLPSATSAAWVSALGPRDVAVSPDGRTIAYSVNISSSAGGPVILLSLTSGALRTVPVVARSLFWSHGSGQIAVNVGDAQTPRLAIIRASDGSVTTLTSRSDGAPVSLLSVLGWLDEAHLAVVYAPTFVMSPARAGSPAAVEAPTENTLGAMDASTGDLRPIASIPDSASVYLTPDGSHALVVPSAGATSVEVIATATGVVRPLPGMTQRLAGLTEQLLASSTSRDNGWTTAGIWQPTTNDLAVSFVAPADASGSGGLTRSSLWLLDADQDAATQLGANRTPLAWTPDGATLFLAGSTTNDPTDTTDPQPNLYALAPVGQGGVETLLASGMGLFLGLVRTA